MHRRRFLSITAGAACAVSIGPAYATGMTQWRGVALGAEASIMLDHPQADRLIAAARAEINRLEEVFSLHRPTSALSQLNASGWLAAPPFELLDCLSLAGRVHETTGGAFDPTVQPLWAAYAEHAAQGEAGLLPSAEREAALARVGWQNVGLDPAEIRLGDGTKLTLNGIAQGFIADRVAALLRGEGLMNVMVNTGEMHAVGSDPRGGPWQVGLRGENGNVGTFLELANAALATSAPLGTVFDNAGTIGHILDPRSGYPAPDRWRDVSVIAPHAALADALSTAFTLMTRTEIDTALTQWPTARIAQLVAVAG